MSSLKIKEHNNMKDQKLEINFRSCLLNELNTDEQGLVRAAMQATSNSYAKYSHFCVGAAVRLADAERSAIFAAQSQYPDQAILQLAIAARNPNGFLESPITPCGACRQVMMEIEDRYGICLKIFLYGSKELYIIESVKDMLPFSFIDKNMRG